MAIGIPALAEAVSLALYLFITKLFTLFPVKKMSEDIYVNLASHAL